MWNLVSMFIMWTLWQRRRVTLCQHGRIVAIGKVVHISDHWLVINDVAMANGQRIRQLCVSRNRIDAFWRFQDGDDSRLASFDNVIPQTVDLTAPARFLRRGLAAPLLSVALQCSSTAIFISCTLPS